ncbi:MAG: IS1096 element passenger TnpR family protein, partial [Prolixibacteraceae bacterium]
RKFLLKAELDGEHTFFDLHSVIQKGAGYEPYQLASFFLSDDGRMKTKEISLLDQGFDGGVYFIMQKTRLSNLLKSKGQKFFYTFDFFDDRSFYIELTGIIMKKNLNEPLVTLKQGDTPVQVLGDEMFEQESANLQEEEVFMDFGEVDDYTQLYGEMEDF